ncbi:MAG: aldolase/citrate lyase family protein [Pseudomonadota bacterium]
MDPADKLKRLSGGLPVGCVWLGLGSAMAAEAAGVAGARLAVVDAEHGVVDPGDFPAILRALALTGAAGIVRVPEASSGVVKRALDSGAAGILFPQIESAEAARAAVALTLFPPLGVRGSALGAVRAAGFGTDAGYGRRWNDEAFAAVQIESQRGLSSAAQIAAVPGVDMLFFGPFDYATDAGLDPVADAQVLEAVFAEIVEAAHAAGKLVGVFPWPGADLAALARQDADMVAVAADVRAVVDGVAAGLAAFAGA